MNQMRIAWSGCGLVLLLAAGLATAQEPDSADRSSSTVTTSAAESLFEKKIRPVLVAECYGCHAAGEGRQVKGGLALDTRAGFRQGGDSGPVVIPGKPEESLLIAAIAHAEGARAMPPKKKLPETVLADFTEWVRLGAVDPRDEAGSAPARSAGDAAQHWSFQPPQRVAAPAVQTQDWPFSDIDRFVLARLEAHDLRPVADTDWATLLRRVTFDLTGLPPTPGGHATGRLRAGGRSIAGLAPFRRALGAALARRGAVCRFGRV